MTTTKSKNEKTEPLISMPRQAYCCLSLQFPFPTHPQSSPQSRSTPSFPSRFLHHHSLSFSPSSLSQKKRGREGSVIMNSTLRFSASHQCARRCVISSLINEKCSCHRLEKREEKFTTPPSFQHRELRSAVKKENGRQSVMSVRVKTVFPTANLPHVSDKQSFNIRRSFRETFTHTISH